MDIDNNSNDTENTADQDHYILREAISGAFFGIMLMVITFLFIHYVLGFKAFS